MQTGEEKLPTGQRIFSVLEGSNQMETTEWIMKLRMAPKTERALPSPVAGEGQMPALGDVRKASRCELSKQSHGRNCWRRNLTEPTRYIGDKGKKG